MGNDTGVLAEIGMCVGGLHSVTAKTKSKCVQRDEHEIFFRPASKQAQKMRSSRENRKTKLKKAKPKVLTDKERADFARRHWAEHHGTGAAAQICYIYAIYRALVEDSGPPWATSPQTHGYFNPNTSDLGHTPCDSRRQCYHQ